MLLLHTAQHRHCSTCCSELEKSQAHEKAALHPRVHGTTAPAGAKTCNGTRQLQGKASAAACVAHTPVSTSGLPCCVRRVRMHVHARMACACMQAHRYPPAHASCFAVRHVGTVPSPECVRCTRTSTQRSSTHQSTTTPAGSRPPPRPTNCAATPFPAGATAASAQPRWQHSCLALH